MNKRVVVVLVVVVAMVCGAVSASAQLRLDMDINVPICAGITVSGVSQTAWNSFFIPFPDARLSYQFGVGPVNLGVGARMFTVIIENFLYPEIYAELVLGKFVASVNVGGLAFLEFGLLSSVLDAAGVGNLTGYQPVILPDISVAFKATDWFRVQAGLFVIAPFASSSSLGDMFSNNVFAGYITARFVALFK
jgi:hypothetical protein